MMTCSVDYTEAVLLHESVIYVHLFPGSYVITDLMVIPALSTCGLEVFVAVDGVVDAASIGHYERSLQTVGTL